MTARPLFAVVVAMLAAAAVAAAAPSAPAPQDDAGAVARGRYLVQNVGMCVDCHGSTLHGSRLDFLAPGLPVARVAPRIAGLPHFTVAQAVTFLTAGTLPNGSRARPPMPQYRLRRDDAVALTAYLKSLR